MMTVLMPTHNGGDTLERTLENLCLLEQPKGGWVLLIVNNASTDNTEKLIYSFRERLPIKYIIEPKLGKNNALNTGIEHAEGDAIIFTDDDILADRQWLVEWRNGIDRYPECSIFGGSVEPYYEATPPTWLFKTDWERVLYAKTDPDPEGPISGGTIFGLNMAIRVEALASGVRFDGRLLVGASGLMGDEVDFVERLAAAGNARCFIPAARVRHIVQRSQVSILWMLKRFQRHGRTMFHFEVRQRGRRTPEIFHVPRYLFRRLATAAMLLPVLALRFNSLETMKLLRQIAYDLGALSQARVLAQQESTFHR
jgi:glycosyltransferase involved in cell wall biosynthesis